MLTQDAIDFLDRCRFNDKSHAERMGLTKIAKELYPDTGNDRYIPPDGGPADE